MPFASRADLLARTNARRLAQLAVPADMAMPPEAALRVAIDGGSLAGYSADEQTALAGALDAIDTCLADADALILSYGIPDTVQTTLIARLSSTVALYYLHGAERMTDDAAKAYQGVMDTLNAHATGRLSLIPPEPPLPTDPVVSDDLVQFESSARRYGVTSTVIEDW
ncbi:phage protein Gp36 family protein [Methylomonas sp. HW2-6]|uniref:phage protein Gp36 family protein n=1 Tax=Methylomonas sp. HW2-6 TaxID=3376687 RepID=UPI004042AAFA